MHTALYTEDRVAIWDMLDTGAWSAKRLIGCETQVAPWTACIKVVNYKTKYLGKLNCCQAVWLLGRGPITCGCTISHLCASTNQAPFSQCINLHHMRKEPIADNTRRNKEQWDLVKYWNSHKTKEIFAAGPLFMRDIDGVSPILPTSSFLNCQQIGDRPIKGLYWFHPAPRRLTIFI